MLKTLKPGGYPCGASPQKRKKIDAFDAARIQRGETLDRVVAALLADWPEYDVPSFAECLREIADQISPPHPDPRIHHNRPTFLVKPEGRFFYPRSEDGIRLEGCHLVFECPRCGATNRHGGLYGKPGEGDGHRCAHCECWPHGYNIVEEGGPNQKREREIE